MFIGALLENDRHITITFNGHEETAADYKGAVSALAHAASWWSSTLSPIKADLTGELAQFGPPGSRVWVTLVDSQDLELFRPLLTDALDARGIFYGNQYAYNPHVTMTKWKKPKNGLTGELVIDRLAVFSNEFGTTEMRI